MRIVTGLIEYPIVDISSILGAFLRVFLRKMPSFEAQVIFIKTLRLTVKFSTKKNSLSEDKLFFV